MFNDKLITPNQFRKLVTNNNTQRVMRQLGALKEIRATHNVLNRANKNTLVSRVINAPRFNNGDLNSVTYKLKALKVIHDKHNSLNSNEKKQLDIIVMGARKFNKRNLNRVGADVDMLTRAKVLKNIHETKIYTF